MTAPEHIIRICPDFKAYLWDDEDVTHDLADLQDKEGKPIVMPELDAWAQEIEPIVVASETGQPYEKDWADYHKRGQELARRLRRRLSSGYELWYETPYEDKSGTIPERIRIDEEYDPDMLKGDCYYVQWVIRDNIDANERLLAFHYFKYYGDDGAVVYTYSIEPDTIGFEDAGFGPGCWEVCETDMWQRITKEQYDAWVSKIEGLKKSMFALADGHTYEKDNIEVGDVIMTKYGYYQVLEVYEAPLCVRANWLYIGEYGINFYFEEDDDNAWVEDPDDLKGVNGGQHVEKAIFDQAVTTAREYTKNLIDELIECIYNG